MFLFESSAASLHRSLMHAPCQVITSLQKQTIESEWISKLAARLPKKAFSKLKPQVKLKLEDQAAFGLQVMSCFVGHGMATYTSFGLPEAVMVTEGTLCCAGVLAEKIDGDTMSKKAASLSSKSKAELSKLVEGAGFAVKLAVAGSTIFVLEGMFVVHWAPPSEQCVCLRWGYCAAGTNRDTVDAMALGMLAEHPDMESFGYATRAQGLADGRNI